MFLLQWNGTNALQCLQWHRNVHGVGLYCVLWRQADVYKLRDGASLSEVQCRRRILGGKMNLFRKILSCLKWCIAIALLFGVAVFCIAYVINAVHDACRAGVWSQQQKNTQVEFYE